MVTGGFHGNGCPTQCVTGSLASRASTAAASSTCVTHQPRCAWTVGTAASVAQSESAAWTTPTAHACGTETPGLDAGTLQEESV